MFRLLLQNHILILIFQRAIHSEHDFYKNTYQDYHIISDDFKYGSQWKGREQKDRKVKHLYITNFITEDKKNLDIFDKFGII